MDTKNIMYIFDVDGVLSDVFVDEIDAEILSIIAKKINDGEKVAFNTGRNSTYILEKIITPLRKFILHKSSLDNVLIVSEMGGEQTTFNKGIPTTDHTEFSMKAADIQTAKRIFEEGNYKTIKLEHDKATMVSASTVKGSKQSEFIAERENLHERLSKAFVGKPVEITTTVGSVDLFAQGAGKKGGAKIIANWLKGHTKITHDEFVCFGDSPSDYVMAVYFTELGMNVKFIFTGKDEQMPVERVGVPIIKTVKLYSAGTKDYLKKSEDN